MNKKKYSNIIFDEEFLLKTTQDLIRIKAVNNPPYITDYTKIIHYISELLKSFGFDVTIEGKEHFPNIIGRLPKVGKTDKCIMFNAHLDTVPEGDSDKWLHPPFSGIYENGYVYGRGATDMRGSIASLLTLSKAIHDYKISFEGELAISFVSGHETGSINGSVFLSENYPDMLRADMCFIPEPTNFKLSVASRGIYWIKATTYGVEGHTATYNEISNSGIPQPPVNAIHKMNYFIHRLLDIDSWMSYEPHPRTGKEDGMYSEKPIIEVNLIHAGEKQNTVPSKCSATIDIRFLPSQTPEKILLELEELILDIKKSDKDFKIQIEKDMIQSPPMNVPIESDLYKLAQRNFKKVRGRDLEVCGVCSPGDAVAFGKIMPVAWFGPNWNNAHGINEKIHISDLLSLTKIYYSIAEDYLSID